MEATATRTWKAVNSARKVGEKNLGLLKMVGPARFERATLCLEGRCSIQLSYGPVHLFYQ